MSTKNTNNPLGDRDPQPNTEKPGKVVRLCEMQVRKVIKDNDPLKVYELAPCLARASTAEYMTHRDRLKDHFGRNASMTNLDKVVREERKNVEEPTRKSRRTAGEPTVESQDTEELNTFDLVDLLEEELEPLQWIIPDYLPEGATLFFSRPKIGKSMLGLALCLRMARRTSGGVDGEVLYLSLDDKSKRRLQSRARSLLEGLEVERGRVYISIHSGTLDSNLATQLERWMAKHPGTRLIVIDVYARIKPKKKNDDIFKSDYDAVVKLQEFAVKHHIAILLMHHTRKQRESADWIDNANGSTGLTAAPDTLWTLERKPGSSELTLRAQGRDFFRELAVEVRLDDLDDEWKVKGEESSKPTSVTNQKILDLLKSDGGELSPKKVAELTGSNYSTVKNALVRMHAKGMVDQTALGAYKSRQAQQELHSLSHTSHINTCDSCDSCDSIHVSDKQHMSNSAEQASKLRSQESQESHVNIYDREEEDKDSQQAEQYEQPTNSNGKPPDWFPDCPTCKNNKRVHHIEMNSYGCNNCGRKFYA